ncbi:MAG: recombinase family protein [Dehalococcoidales bacterium]
MVNNTDHIIRVAIYTRVSSQEQVDNGTSLESQAEQLEAFCKGQKWEIFNHYVDGGFSGKDGNRPGLESLRRDAKAGYFEKVAVWKLDRLARNQRLILELEAEFREQDISLFSIKEMVDTQTSIGRTVFQVLGLTAEWERDNIAERTKTGRLQRMKDGYWASGRAPFGYDYNKETKHLVINEKEAEIVRKIFDLYASGKSLGSIADILNKELVSPRGKNSKGWYNNSARHVLINPTYKGEAIVNRHCHISDINNVDLSKAIKIAVPPIVSEDKWNIAQSRLSNNKHLKPAEKGVFTLQGLIKCGVCGCSYGAKHSWEHRNYTCRGKLKTFHIDGSPRCTNRNIRADLLEQVVYKRAIDILDDPNKLQPLVIEAINKLKERESALESRLMPIEKRLKEITKMKSRLADKFIIDNMDADKYKIAQQNLEKEEARLFTLRREADPNELGELESTRGYLRFWQNQVTEMKKNLEEPDEDKRVMFKTTDEPHKKVRTMLNVGDNDLSERMQFPTTQRELFDKLQLRLIVFKDKIEVKAVFPMPDITYQECTLTSRSTCDAV